MKARPIRILIAGSPPRMRDMALRYVASISNSILVGVVNDGEQAIEAVHHMVPNVLVLDAEIPGVQARTVVHRVLTQHPHVGIVAWISLNEPYNIPDDKA